MRVEKKEDVFNKYIIDWCPEHNEPIVEPLTNDKTEPESNVCMKCMGKKETSLTEFSELIEKWEKMILEYLERMVFSGDNQIAISEKIKGLFEFRNKSFGVLGKDVDKSSETEFVPIIEIDPFIHTSYLLKLASSQKLQEEKKSRVIQAKGIPPPEDYQIEKIVDATKLLFEIKYSHHLVENGMRKVSLVSLKDRFKDNNTFYEFSVKNELYFEIDGDKYWYEAFDLPVMDKIYKMMSYHGGYNKNYLEDRKSNINRLQPVWPTALRELENNGIKQQINGFTKDEKLMLDAAHNWYQIISPTKFHADQFNTSFLEDMDHNDIYKLFRFFQSISKSGIFIIPIEDLESSLKKNGLDYLLEELLSKMVIFYPVWVPNTVKDGLYLLTAKNVYEIIEKALNIKSGIWSDDKIPLGYYYVAIKDGKNADAIVFDYTVIFFYAGVKLLYNRDKANIKNREDGNFFEKQIVPYYFKKNGYDYIKSEIITESIKKTPDVSYMDIEIDGILIDKKNKNIFVVEVKSITPKYSDVISKGTLSVMAMRFLVELTGEKIKDTTSDEIRIVKKKNNPTMARRTKLVKENWEKMNFSVDIDNINKYDFKSLIITNVPVPISEKTIQELGFPILSLYDIMYELPKVLDKHK